MNKGIGILGFFQFFFGVSNLLYGFGALGFYILTSPNILPNELLPYISKNFLNNPLLNFFLMPYLIQYFFLIGLISIITGILIIFTGYQLNKATKLYSGIFSTEQNIWSNRTINIFLSFILFSSIIYLLHGITIQLGGI